MRTLLVTGGSRGIGAATVRLAAARGYAVVVNYLRSTAAAQSLVDEINNGGGRACAIQADISREDQVLSLFHEIDVNLGPITVLVNNASILEPQMRLE